MAAGDGWRYVLTVDGRDIDLADGEVTLGRSRTATVRVEHESVSRSHALVMFDKGNAVVKDLNSSNGTWVSGKRVSSETRLKDGDRIQLGAAVVGLRIVAPEGDKTAMIDQSLVPGAREPQPEPVKPVTFEHVVEPIPEPPVPVPSPLEISANDLLRGSEKPPAEPVPAPALAVPPPLPRPAPVDVAPPPPPREPAPPPRPAAPVPPPPPVPRAHSAPRPVPREEPRFEPREEPRAYEEDWAPRRPATPSFGAAPEAGVPENLAGILPRFLALLVDNVILLALDLIFLSPVFLILFFRPGARTGGPDLMLATIGFLCFLVIAGANIWYVIGGWAKAGKTPGKALLGLCIVSPTSGIGEGLGWKTALLRAVGYIAGAIPFYLGFLMALFRKDRRALHDVIADTWVVSLR